MENMIDVRQLLKRYNSFIYTGDRKQDLHLMLDELKHLYHNQLILTKDYQSALLIIKRELRHLNV